jgi:hypothetical protein
MSGKKYGTKTKTVDLSECVNWPRRVPKDEWWQELEERVRECPAGEQVSWGIPFAMTEGSGRRVILVTRDSDEVTVRLKGTATYLCFLHTWEQMPDAVRADDPTEGLVVGEYELAYQDGSRHVQPVRARFEVGMAMAESPGPPWLAMGFRMHETIDPAGPVPAGTQWGTMQTGLQYGSRRGGWAPLIYAMPNPHPKKTLRRLTIRGLCGSPLLVAGLTLYRGAGHPLAHLPRRAYRIKADGKTEVEKVEVDLGIAARIERANAPRRKKWLDAPGIPETPGAGEDVVHIVGAEDATVSVRLAQGDEHAFSLGEAFHEGKSASDGGATLRVLGRERQWMQVRVVDGSTGRPTPVRIHFSGSRGEYIAPYGHHEQVTANWFEDYGADLSWSGRSYAYVPGEFTTDMPVGDVYVELCKGFEYAPVRRKVAIQRGQKTLELQIDRWADLRGEGWVTADTHVHFISPQTAWLEGQAEGINVVNLLASQWGRLFTNVGDLTGRVGVVEDDTIVYVGTENRNHMLGHISMLGTQGLPVYPMCAGGPGESWVGDPDFITLAEWALENKRKGGVVIRPHYPYCGHTEDPVPIIKGLVDALEINVVRGNGFPVQEWYRYLNCGYRVAVAGGTDKMGAYCALGWLRTYAKLNPDRPFTYARWAKAVRAGRTFSTSGPLIDLRVDGKGIGDTIRMSKNGGKVEVRATAKCFHPLAFLEIVYNGQVVASNEPRGGAQDLEIAERVRIPASGWIAARCYGLPSHAGARNQAAHTSPVYVTCGDTRAFDGPAAEHMLALVEGGIEYLNTIATVYDESSRKRMVKQFKEVRKELVGRLVVEAGHEHHHGKGPYHTHGHGGKAGHHHVNA